MVETQTGAINQYGSVKGVQFLQENEMKTLKFMEFVGMIVCFSVM